MTRPSAIDPRAALRISHPSPARPARSAGVRVAVATAVAALVVVSFEERLRTQAPPTARTYGYDVVKVYPHDPGAFTQGLLFRDGFLFESTGREGRSSLRRVRLETGEVVQRVDLDARYFAEGLTDLGSRLLQLTYTTNIGFVYDLRTFSRERSFSYEGEGWGLAHDDRRVIMSDGTPTLRFLDPATQRELGRLTVRDGTRLIDDLNELEFVKGEILANVWTTDRIAIIDPATGAVTGWLDLSGIRPRSPGIDVLNGIAYDAAGDRLFVTGKLWPRLFHIRLRR
jgi:glutamine cyclotransferase